MSLPGGGLSICEDSAIVSTQNIYEGNRATDDTTDHTFQISDIQYFVMELIIRTLDNLLGAGVVHLLLGGVGWKHSIKHVGLPLWRAWTTTNN